MSPVIVEFPDVILLAEESALLSVKCLFRMLFIGVFLVLSTASMPALELPITSVLPLVLATAGVLVLAYADLCLIGLQEIVQYNLNPENEFVIFA